MTQEQESLLVYVSAKLASVEAMLSIALPKLIATAAAPKMEESDPENKAAVLQALGASQAYAESLARMTRAEIEFFCEQFPHLAHQMRSYIELSCRDRLYELNRINDKER